MKSLTSQQLTQTLGGASSAPQYANKMEADHFFNTLTGGIFGGLIFGFLFQESPLLSCMIGGIVGAKVLPELLKT